MCIHSHVYMCLYLYKGTPVSSVFFTQIYYKRCSTHWFISPNNLSWWSIFNSRVKLSSFILTAKQYSISVYLSSLLNIGIDSPTSIFLIKIPLQCMIFVCDILYYCQFSSVQSVSRVRLFATPWIAARQASLSITNSGSSLRLTSIESVMPSSHLILCHPLLLLPPNPSQHQSLFQWVNSSHEVAKVLEFQI